VAALKVQQQEERTMNREDIDRMWFQAMRESIGAGDSYIRYRFAALVAAAEREALVHLAEGMDFGDGLVAIDDLVTALKQRGEA
jgi:hypothetical protein